MFSERLVRAVRSAVPRQGIVTLDYGNPDFVRYAEAYGAKGWRIEQAATLEPLLTTCLEEPAVHVIDIPVEYSLNKTTLFDRIPQLRAKL